ncbi:tripartite tricarboxylate transporter substrate binding protein [Ramlibacter sp. AW1]|uniref:Tripartite tricarboxylate transporter substrate binding protein n=1 Tax=Ramlibacter aurantiacus TaxID=2801330 RepID=A0A937D6F3_9BURK|nr:tripartite tricarboxylate transporter substrate binding protein [Ramlibacter aurantiacus]MBL0420893.1 tripartite tricarboxylate transporter substrate binding protein [Ramlibacter aurantiacus]
MHSIHRRQACLCAAALAAAAAFPLAASAQAAWPTRTVTLVVPTSAGSAPDIYARVLAEQLGRQTGGTFIVENRVGANGNVAIEYVLRGPDDGSLLFLGTQSILTINPSAYSQLRWKPSDLTPIIKGVASPMVLVTHPSVPARNFGELREWIPTQKGKLAYASFSAGTPSHFLGYQLNERLKADMVHVAYKGSAPQVNDILGGQVPLGFTQLAVAVAHIKAGKLNALAVTGPERDPALPQVPTLAELGLGELSTAVWFGVLAPAAAPAPVKEAILQAMVKAHADPGVRAKLQAQNFSVPAEAGAAFGKSMAEETVRWAGIVKATGFRAVD